MAREQEEEEGGRKRGARGGSRGVSPPLAVSRGGHVTRRRLFFPSNGANPYTSPDLWPLRAPGTPRGPPRGVLEGEGCGARRGRGPERKKVRENTENRPQNTGRLAGCLDNGVYLLSFLSFFAGMECHGMGPRVPGGAGWV